MSRCRPKQFGRGTQERVTISFKHPEAALLLLLRRRTVMNWHPSRARGTSREVGGQQAMACHTVITPKRRGKAGNQASHTQHMPFRILFPPTIMVIWAGLMCGLTVRKRVERACAYLSDYYFIAVSQLVGFTPQWPSQTCCCASSRSCLAACLVLCLATLLLLLTRQMRLGRFAGCLSGPFRAPNQ